MYLLDCFFIDITTSITCLETLTYNRANKNPSNLVPLPILIAPNCVLPLLLNKAYQQQTARNEPSAPPPYPTF